MPIGWCKKMTQEDLANRPKIPVLIQQAKEQCKGKGELEKYFCSKCLEKPAISVDKERKDPEMENLSKYGTEVNERNAYGLPQLSATALEGREDIVRMLLEAKAITDERDQSEKGTALHWAVEGGHLNIVKLLLDEGHADINAESLNHGTPLSWAVQKESIDTAQLLLDKGADVGVKNRTGSTPLHLAAQSGHEALVELLLDMGADPLETDKEGRTALKLAEERGNGDAVELLKVATPDGPSPAAVDQGQAILDEIVVGTVESAGSEPAKTTRNELSPHRPAIKSRTSSSRSNTKAIPSHTRFAEPEKEIQGTPAMFLEIPNK
jgi:ankyrin repeat protein